MLMLSKEMTDQVCKSLLFSFQCQASGGVGQANHQNFFVRSLPRVEILIICDQGLKDIDHLHLPPVGNFDQLFCPRDGESKFLKQKRQNPHPIPDCPPSLIGTLT